MRQALVTTLVFLLLLAGFEFVLARAKFSYGSGAWQDVYLSPSADEGLRSPSGLCQLDTQRMWCLRAGAEVPGCPAERINADGLRGPTIPRARTPGVARVVILGGTTAFGYGITWRDTLAARLEQALDSGGLPAEILDAGVPEHAAWQVLRHGSAVVREWKPDVVVITFLDELGFHPSWDGRSDREKIERLATFAPDVFEHGAGSVRSLQLARWLCDMASGRRWDELESSMMSLQMAGRFGTLDWPGTRRVPIEDLQAAIEGLRDAARSVGARMIAVFPPPDPSRTVQPIYFEYAKACQGWCYDLGIACIDLRASYLAAIQIERLPREDLFLADGYPSACAHQRIARAVSDEILEPTRGSGARPDSARETTRQGPEEAPR